MDGIKDDTQKSRLRRIGQVMRMGDERIPKEVLHTKMEGKRQTERPRTRWID